MLHSHTSSYSHTHSESHSSNSQSNSQASLQINVTTATELTNVQTVGKQDPFLQFSLNFEDKKSFIKTFTQKNAGTSATWNQSFTVPLNGEPDLFIEVLDAEATVDEVIGFCAIPINQIVHADGAYLNGFFELYDTKGERAGLVNLQLAAQGFPNSRNPDFNGEPVQCQSYLHEGHCARMKSNKKKATGVSVGGALLGGAFAIGAGFLGKKLYDDKQADEEEEARLREEEEVKKQEEETKRQQERDQFDQERAEFQRQKSSSEQEQQPEEQAEGGECERKEERKHENREKEHHRRRRDSNSSNSSNEDSDAKKWNPVGTYAAGDRVKYHGQVYMCLQGHTSNPTWQPGAAHSLWQAE